MFEAGALSKYVEKARVVPLLLGLKPAELQGPLAQFQALQATESEVKKLIKGVNQTVIESMEKGLGEIILDESFGLWWPKLKESIDKTQSMKSGVETKARTEKDMLEETLVLVRDIRRKMSTLTTGSRRGITVVGTSTKAAPTPPDNFPAGWEAEWEPTFNEPDEESIRQIVNAFWRRENNKNDKDTEDKNKDENKTK
jgi:hypothetical protein